MIHHDRPRRVFEHMGYIAGDDMGVSTRAGVPTSLPLYLYEVGGGNALLKLVARQASLNNGHYLFMGLDPSKQYLVMARDHNREYEPAVWDYVTPATDLTIAEQQTLWERWNVRA